MAGLDPKMNLRVVVVMSFEKGDDSVGIVGGGHVDRTETAGGLFLLLGSEGEEGKVALIGRSKHGNFW